VRRFAAVLALLAAAGAAEAAMIFDPQSGCATSNPFPRQGESVRWSGGCRDGLLDGPGTLVWLENGVEYERDDGVFLAGELHGEAIITFANGGRIQGRYRAGARDGEFLVERPDGSVVRSNYENGLFVGERPMSEAEAQAWRAGRPFVARASAPPPPPPAAARTEPPPSPPQAAMPRPAAPPPPVAAAPPPSAPAPPPVAAAPPPPAPAPPPVAAARPPAASAPQPAPLALRLPIPQAEGERLGLVPLARPGVALRPPSQAPASLAPPLFSPQPAPPESLAPAAPLPVAPPPSALTVPPAPAAPTAPQLASAPTGRYAVSLSGAAIRDAAETVLGGILKRRYVVEPGVSGTVSISAESFVDPAALLSAFRREAQRNGADLVDQDGVLRLVSARFVPPPAPPASAIGRRACSRPDLYDGGAQWCGVVRGETADAYDIEVLTVSPNSAFASGLGASPCTGGDFLSRFERGKRFAAPKRCLEVQG